MPTPIRRRTFLEANTLGMVAAAAGSVVEPVSSANGSAPTGPEPWYKKAYRRAVIDMHIPDWDAQFLSQFDPQQYADALKESQAQSVVCYCHSHVGLFNYPTEVGKQHAAFRGRNVLQEMIDACHERGIAVVLYCSLIFDRWAGDEHPEWRMRRWDGNIHGEGGRHALLCINSPYRDYVHRYVEEICSRFDFEGIRFDMTFWPAVCYCQHCRTRFQEEVGGNVPETVNWLDAKWVAFQRCRERWLVEFAQGVTAIVRRKKPKATVEHQASTFPLHWVFGVTAPLRDQCDFLQGDFYGDQLQGSFVRKLLEDLTLHRPFAYETSSSVSLRDHTALKSEALLSAKAAAAIADHAAFVFIDAIDPVGTIHRLAHQRMGRVFQRWNAYYAQLGGERIADVGIYYSLESKFSFRGNGRHVSNADTSDSHTEAAMKCAARLLTGHWLFRVITRNSLDQLDRIRVLLLPQVNMMSDAECRIIREWVARGGRLYASAGTSAVDLDGRLASDFLLGDVLGVSLREANWQPYPHYLAPTPAGQPWFGDFDARYPAFANEYGFRVQARAGAEVLATTTLPWSDNDPSHFSSIHSDPPWQTTEQPEVTRHRFGQGVAIYAATPLESVDVLGDAFQRMLQELCSEPTLQLTAPSAVEATLFHQPDRMRYVLTLVNFQDKLPNIPIDGIVVRLKLPNGHRPVTVVSLPDGQFMRMEQRGHYTAFRCGRLETLAMYAIEYRES